MGSFLVGRSQKRYNRPVELCFLSLRDRTLVSSTILCLILKLSCGLIGRHTVLYFLPKTPHLLATKYKIRPLVVRQNGSNIHWSVPTSLDYLPTYLYTSVADFIHVRRLVESALNSHFYNTTMSFYIGVLTTSYKAHVTVLKTT